MALRLVELETPDFGPLLEPDLAAPVLLEGVEDEDDLLAPGPAFRCFDLTVRVGAILDRGRVVSQGLSSV